MTAEQAIKVVAQVCEGYRGTAQEHRTLAEAIKVLNVLIANAKPEAAEK